CGVGQLPRPEEQQHHREDDEPMPDAQRTHVNLRLWDNTPTLTHARRTVPPVPLREYAVTCELVGILLLRHGAVGRVRRESRASTCVELRDESRVDRTHHVRVTEQKAQQPGAIVVRDGHVEVAVVPTGDVVEGELIEEPGGG